jgi:hypothetical protein
MDITQRLAEISPETIDSIERGILRDAGWSETCDNPGTLWLWEKEIGGRVYRVSQQTAIRLESAIQEEPV